MPKSSFMHTSAVSEMAIIREMDADELQQYAQRIQDDINWYGPNMVYQGLLRRVKKQYMQITGIELQTEYRCPA